jgi:hypothetical protein
MKTILQKLDGKTALSFQIKIITQNVTDSNQPK